MPIGVYESHYSVLLRGEKYPPSEVLGSAKDLLTSCCVASAINLGSCRNNFDHYYLNSSAVLMYSR